MNWNTQDLYAIQREAMYQAYEESERKKREIDSLRARDRELQRQADALPAVGASISRDLIHRERAEILSRLNAIID